MLFWAQSKSARSLVLIRELHSTNSQSYSFENRPSEADKYLKCQRFFQRFFQISFFFEKHSSGSYKHCKRSNGLTSCPCHPTNSQVHCNKHKWVLRQLDESQIRNRRSVSLCFSWHNFSRSQGWARKLTFETTVYQLSLKTIVQSNVVPTLQ